MRHSNGLRLAFLQGVLLDLREQLVDLLRGWRKIQMEPLDHQSRLVLLLSERDEHVADARIDLPVLGEFEREPARWIPEQLKVLRAHGGPREARCEPC